MSKESGYWKTGEVLPNGAQVLLASVWGEAGNQHGDWVVLAFWHGRDHPNVTWRMGPRGDTCWGHYFPDTPEGQKAALLDYQQRCASLAAMQERHDRLEKSISSTR